MNAVEMLDALIEQLDEGVRAKPDSGDAIDAILAASVRRTSVASLGEHEAVAKFREELHHGFARVETVGRVLELVRQVVGVLAVIGA